MAETETLEPDKIFDNDIEIALDEFCQINGILDMKKESQAVWNSALRHIYKRVFRDKSTLKSKAIRPNGEYIPTNFNAYNYALVLEIVDIYIYDLCMKYDKEVSIIGFSTMTGIENQLIHEWGNGNTKLSTLSLDIYKKLSQFREESLSNKIVSGKVNPVGPLAALNRHYGWNLPGVSKEHTTKSALNASQLPKLGNDTQQPLQLSGDSK